MRKFEVPTGLSHGYVTQKPSGRHKSIRIIKKHRTGKMESVKHPTLDAINRGLLDKTFTLDEALEQVGLLVERLYKDDGVKVRRVTSNKTNQKMLDQFMEGHYHTERRKRMVDYEAARQSFQRAIDALGEVSVLGPADQIAKKLRESYGGNAQRRRAAAIDSIRKFHGLLDKIDKDEEEKHTPTYLTWEEFVKVRAFMNDPLLELASTMAFCTGARIGELIYASRGNFDKETRYLSIERQIDKNGKPRRTKNKTVRNASVLLPALDLIDEWSARRHEITPAYRGKLSAKFKAACMKAFPNERDKHLTFHGLRHCYARHWARGGLSTDEIAKLIGDDPKVTRKYYSGWVVDKDRASMLKTIGDAQFKKKAKKQTRKAA